MYCDGPCNWWEPAMLAYFGMIALMVIVPLLLIYGLYRLNRWIQEDRER